MKYFLFLALIAVIYSFNCKAEYISVASEGKYKSILWSSSCSCPAGTVSLIDKSQERCFCYIQAELNECKRDSRCKC